MKQIRVSGPDSIEADWTLGGYLKLPWQPYIDTIDGHTVSQQHFAAIQQQSCHRSQMKASVLFTVSRHFRSSHMHGNVSPVIAVWHYADYRMHPLCDTHWHHWCFCTELIMQSSSISWCTWIFYALSLVTLCLMPFGCVQRCPVQFAPMLADMLDSMLLELLLATYCLHVSLITGVCMTMQSTKLVRTATSVTILITHCRCTHSIKLV